VQLDQVLAKAGEGTVYTVAGDPSLVAKVFHPDRKDLQQKRDKITAMIAAPPAGATQADGFTVLTWPQQPIETDDGLPGYSMARIDTSNAVEIHTFSNPVDRANPLPGAPQWTVHASWGHLVNAAANLCLAVESVHSVDAVIGDFQERNILVNDTTRVTLVDCDSMQFSTTDGRRFLCAVGRPEFTAPELSGVDLSATPRHRSSDLFALAVHIHLLLMAGNHPFLRGTWTGPGDQPDALTLAKSGEWAGGPNSRLRTHPLAPPPTFLPAPIQQLFARAFTEGAVNPASRPSAAEWRSALSAIALTSCANEHQIPVAAAAACPWCAIDTERQRRRAQQAAAAPPRQPAAQQIYRVETPSGVPQGAPAPRRKIWPVAASIIGIVAAVIAGTAVYSMSTTSGRNGITLPVSEHTIRNIEDAPGSYLPVQPTARPSTPAAVPTNVTATLVGTCDEGGTCGVRQRNAPYNAAPNLFSGTLNDGQTVTLRCKTTGDSRSNEGHGTSTTWYQLSNGAYVNAVYFDVGEIRLQSC